MSVAKQEIPASARFARWLLEWAVRHWPEETRPWGLALAAEIDETASAFETVRWSLGGIMLFARSVLSCAWAWMKLPAGGSLPGARGPQGPSLLPSAHGCLRRQFWPQRPCCFSYQWDGRRFERCVRAGKDFGSRLRISERSKNLQLVRRRNLEGVGQPVPGPMAGELDPVPD